jgi:hypothetical protein
MSDSPYHIHPEIPTSKVKSIIKEMSSAFFSLIIFINWGKRETAVHIPAAMPINKLYFCMHVCLTI